MFIISCPGCLYQHVWWLLMLACSPDRGRIDCGSPLSEHLAQVPLPMFLHFLVSCTILFDTKSPWVAHSQGVGTLPFLNKNTYEVALEKQVWVMGCYWIRRSGKETKMKTKRLKAANLKTCISGLFQKKILHTVAMRSKKIVYLNFVICEIKIDFNLGLFFLLILITANSSYLFHCTLICTTETPKL